MASSVVPMGRWMNGVEKFIASLCRALGNGRKRQFRLVILQAPAHWTLPLGLSQFRFQFSTDWPPLMAMDVIATVPIVILYLFFQRYFVGGLSAGAVKG